MTKNKFKTLLRPLINEVMDEIGSSGEAQRQCEKCKRVVPTDSHGYVEGWVCPACRGEGITGASSENIDEVSVTGGVDAPATKFAFGKVKDRVSRQAGYIPVMSEKQQLNENVNFDVRREFFNYTTKSQKLKLDFEAILSRKLTGKKVLVRAKKGVKTNIYIKNYEVDVASVQFDDYDIILKDKGGKVYFVDKNFMIEIVEPAAPAAQAKPAAEVPAAPAAKKPEAPIVKDKTLSGEINK